MNGLFLDVGSNEGVHPEADVAVDLVLNADSWKDWEGRVDVQAEAGQLPFRDGIFEKYYSGACVGSYAGESALLEMLRVTRLGGKIELRVLFPGVPETLRVLLGKMSIHLIETNNSDGAEILDVMIEGMNVKSDCWEEAGETFVSPQQALINQKEYLADVALGEVHNP